MDFVDELLDHFRAFSIFDLTMQPGPPSFDVHKIFGQHSSAAQHLCVVLFFGNVLLYGYVQVAAHHHDFGGRVVVEVDDEVNLAVVREILFVVVQGILAHVDVLCDQRNAPVPGGIIPYFIRSKADTIQRRGFCAGGFCL